MNAQLKEEDEQVFKAIAYFLIFLVVAILASTGVWMLLAIWGEIL